MRKSVMAVAVLLLCLGAAAGPVDARPLVFPRPSRPFGVSYPEWAARFQNWTTSVPAAGNPLLDPTGENCGAGQSGRVWFLTTSFSATVVRNRCVVPVGVSLLIPVGTIVCFATEGESAADMAQCASDFKAGVEGLEASVDGSPIDVPAFRAQSPVFTLNVGEDNVYDLPPGDYSPAVADGYYVILAPLNVGPHTIHFRATYPDPPATIDTTYNLVVAAARAR